MTLPAGLEKAARKGKQVIDRELELALDDVGRMFEARVKARTPVDTGKLYNSIGYELVGSGTLRAGSLFDVGGGPVEYAGYVEFGTSRMTGRGYFFPTIEKSLPEAIEEIEAALARGVSLVFGG